MGCTDAGGKNDKNDGWKNTADTENVSQNFYSSVSSVTNGKDGLIFIFSVDAVGVGLHDYQ